MGKENAISEAERDRRGYPCFFNSLKNFWVFPECNKVSWRNFRKKCKILFLHKIDLLIDFSNDKQY